MCACGSVLAVDFALRVDRSSVASSEDLELVASTQKDELLEDAHLRDVQESRASLYSCLLELKQQRSSASAWVRPKNALEQCRARTVIRAEDSE